MKTIRPALPALEIQRDVSSLLEEGGHVVLSQGRYQILDFIKGEAPSLFHELTRQREIAFRDSGQGSGLSFDETEEDSHYTQLVLWDQEAGRITGAYRIGYTAKVLPEAGAGGLYLSHMFDFEEDFFDRIGPSMELSRSFIALDYQGDPIALSLLWRGLGQIWDVDVTRQSFFGSVTISARYSPRSRSLLVAWLARFRGLNGSPLAKALIPFEPEDEHLAGIDLDDFSRNIDTLREYLTDCEGNPLPVPPLIRHYITLGATFHAFHREASFGDAIYCLLDVDLNLMAQTRRRRLLGC